MDLSENIRILQNVNIFPLQPFWAVSIYLSLGGPEIYRRIC